MKERTTFVGLDAHKEAISVAVLLPGQDKAIEWQCANEATSVRRMLRKIQKQAPAEVHYCYEAGPCGYALQRWMRSAGAKCIVVAPSLIPRKPGERIKTDRRDARKLGALLRAQPAHRSPPAHARRRSRARFVPCTGRRHQDLVRCRHRLSKMLLRRGRVWTGGKRAWSQGHRLWLRSLRFQSWPDQAVLDQYLLAIEQVEQRLQTLEQRIAVLAEQPRYSQAVGALRCFRGVDTVTAMSLVAELHSFMRFESARGLMAFLGLVPSEHSSGSRKQRGAITKAGNGHVRRLLIEAAWHYRHRPSVRSLAARRHGQPARVIAIADRAMTRLHRRFTRLAERGKPRPKVAVAVARELAGFVWAALQTTAH